MRLHTSIGPNPRVVRMYLLEKGLEIEAIDVDLMGAENRREPYTQKNPAGQLPCLELDDGTVIAETVTICEYLEELNPTPPLIGTTPLERATTRMWQRRVELGITEHLYNGFRYAEGAALFQSRMRVLPEAAEGLKAIVRDKMAWLDGMIGAKPYLTGDRFTLADIVLFCAVDFGNTVGQPLDRSLPNVTAWYDRVAARPSAQAG